MWRQCGNDCDRQSITATALTTADGSTRCPCAESARVRRVVVVVATGCHLCAPAIAAATAACAERDVELTVLDIDGDLELEQRYRALIPVVLVDGVEVGHFIVEQSAIEQALEIRRS
ncbi:MAG: hypothetical protein CK540_07170 [Thermoleophilia bacterium]|nr:MAG: hypothetical protein CK540_07170 [Thermoleophilia bacterium]